MGGRLIKKQLLQWMLGLSVLATMGLGACDTADPSQADLPPEPLTEKPGLIAFEAEFLDDIRIVVAPFDDPMAYRFIGDPQRFLIYPEFSPDKTKLLFGDVLGGGEGTAQMFLHDFERTVTEPLPLLEEGADGVLRATASTAVWNESGTGFYFVRIGGIAGGLYHGITYYTFADSRETRMDPYVIPRERIGQDTLIVQEDYPGYAFHVLNLRTETQTPFDHPYLRYLNESESLRYAVRGFSWNEQRKLFVAAVKDSSSPGPRLILTNLDGSFMRTLTSGQKNTDVHPKWGPGNTVIFNRRIYDPVDPTNNRWTVMTIDIDTGEEQEFMHPAMLGALDLYSPDY